MRVTINSLGILLTTIGSFLVWRYLTEINFADKESYLEGKGVLIVPSPSEVDVARFRKSLRLSETGLLLILWGGAFQIVSNYMP